MTYTVHASAFVHTSGIAHIYQNLTSLLQIIPAQHDHMKTTPVINAPPMDVSFIHLILWKPAVTQGWHPNDIHPLSTWLSCILWNVLSDLQNPVKSNQLIYLENYQFLTTVFFLEAVDISLWFNAHEDHQLRISVCITSCTVEFYFTSFEYM